METVYFGKFYKDEKKDGKEKIEWLVLDEDEKTFFLVSKKAIASRRYDQEESEWQYSEIRQWLNSEFFNEAFDTYEKHCIQTTDVITTDWIWGDSDYIGVQTQDKLFLLSGEELEKYFPEQTSRIQEKSAFAHYSLEEERRYTNAWWLRNTGLGKGTAILVAEDGSLLSLVGTQNIEGIRPALRIFKNFRDYLGLNGQFNLYDK